MFPVSCGPDRLCMAAAEHRAKGDLNLRSEYGKSFQGVRFSWHADKRGKNSKFVGQECDFYHINLY